MSEMLRSEKRRELGGKGKAEKKNSMEPGEKARQKSVCH